MQKEPAAKARGQRSVLFLFSDTGGGHRTAAQAIDEALRDLDGGRTIATHHVDAFASCGAFPLREGIFSYGAMLKVQPSPYPALYHLTDGRTRVRVLRELGKPFILAKFRQLVSQLRPDLIVSVHPLLNELARMTIDALRLDAQLVTIITDLVTIHHSWTAETAADEYVVGSREARGVCADRGIPLSRIHDLGLPIRAGFTPPADRERCRAELGLDQRRRTLLVMAGGEGAGRVQRIVSDVAPTLRALDIQLVCIAGKNEALRAKLTETSSRFGEGAAILGFVDNVADYMRAADALLTKAGPGTIAEAFACGLPLIICDYISGQEAGNLDFVQSRGAGIVALDAHSVRRALRRLFRSGSTELHAMREAALRSARPRAARDVAALLTSVLDRKAIAAR